MAPWIRLAQPSKDVANGECFLLERVPMVNEPEVTLVPTRHLRLEAEWVEGWRARGGRRLAMTSLEALLATGQLEAAAEAIRRGHPASAWTSAVLLEPTPGFGPELDTTDLLLASAGGASEWVAEALEAAESTAELEPVIECERAKVWLAVAGDARGALRRWERALAGADGSVEMWCLLAATWHDLGGDPARTAEILRRAEDRPSVAAAEVWLWRLGDEAQARSVLASVESSGGPSAWSQAAIAHRELFDDVAAASSIIERIGRAGDSEACARLRYHLLGDPFLLMSRLNHLEQLLDQAADLASVALAWVNALDDCERAIACLDKAHACVRSADDQRRVRAARHAVARARRSLS